MNTVVGSNPYGVDRLNSRGYDFIDVINILELF